MSEQAAEAAREGQDFEYPDEAGYPDGEGTLDEGTGAASEAEEIDEFADGDEEDVEDV